MGNTDFETHRAMVPAIMGAQNHCETAHFEINFNKHGVLRAPISDMSQTTRQNGGQARCQARHCCVNVEIYKERWGKHDSETHRAVVPAIMGAQNHRETANVEINFNKHGVL